MIERFLPQVASTFAPRIDNLVLLVTILVGFWFVFAEVMFFWLIFRFRHKPGVPSQYVTGDEKHLLRWVTIPHYLVLVCDVVIIIAAIQVWVLIKQSLPPADETVRVTGMQWTWVFQHPGADGQLDTADDIRESDTMHVQVNRTYHVLLESKDVLHSFSVPVFRLKQDVVPGRTITSWFKATKTGKHDIQCTEICGIGHGVMGATILIESPEEHAKWLADHAAVAAAATGTTE